MRLNLGPLGHIQIGKSDDGAPTVESLEVGGSFTPEEPELPGSNIIDFLDRINKSESFSTSSGVQLSLEQTGFKAISQSLAKRDSLNYFYLIVQYSY